MFMNLFGGKSRSTTMVEYWRWRYRDPNTGRICRTLFQLTAEEAAKYPEAERIEGTLLLREVDVPDPTPMKLVTPRGALRTR
jgi:hypothetical protein